MDWQTISASVVASVTSKCIFYPMDTLRMLDQTSTGTGSYLLPISRYWSGLIPAACMNVPGFTTYLVTYRHTKQTLGPHFGYNSVTNFILSGAAAEITSSFIWTPMEVLKGRMQINAHGAGLRETIASVYAGEGFRGFFRGYWMGIVVFMPHSIIWWVTYEKVKMSINSTHVGVAAVAAGSASAVAGASTNFLEVIKIRQQLASAEEIGKIRPDDARGVAIVARNLIRETGIFRALFKGLGVRLLGNAPASALAMLIVEYLHPDPAGQEEEILLGQDQN